MSDWQAQNVLPLQTWEGLIMSAEDIGIVTTSKEALNAVMRALNTTAEEEPAPIPQGQLRGCVLCSHSVASHFGRDGKWRGCLAASPETAFVLVPATMLHGRTGVPLAPAQKLDGASTEPVLAPKQQRAARRLRYYSAIHPRASLDKLDLSDTRRKVLVAIHREGKVGVLSRAVLKRTKLPHGSIQQTLNWLKAQKLIRAEADNPAP